VGLGGKIRRECVEGKEGRKERVKTLVLVIEHGIERGGQMEKAVGRREYSGGSGMEQGGGDGGGIVWRGGRRGGG